MQVVFIIIPPYWYNCSEWIIYITIRMYSIFNQEKIFRASANTKRLKTTCDVHNDEYIQKVVCV